MNGRKVSFPVYYIVSLVEEGEWDYVDIGIDSPDDNRFESAKDR